MKQLTLVRLRKSKLRGKPLSQAGQLSDPQCRQSLLQANTGFRDFKHLRGTPDYDEQGKKEAFAMLRQLGPFSLFWTFSMADMKWSEFLRCLARLVSMERSRHQRGCQDATETQSPVGAERASHFVAVSSTPNGGSADNDEEA
jgi:hypothetical protein